MESFLLSDALATYVVGFGAFFYYRHVKNDQKRDAARIILQEIRRAEEILDGIEKNNRFLFDTKIVQQNSWKSNIHHFAKDLSQNALEVIIYLIQVERK